jgi:sulfur-oxidizing protein SoxY
MLENRRKILKRIVEATAVIGAVLIMPKLAFAKWSKAFDADTTEAAMTGLFNNTETIASDKVFLKVPEIAENGAVVPVNVKTDIENVKSISVVAFKNPQPLACSFTIPEGTDSDVSIRIRLFETMDVQAIVETHDGKLFSVQKEVKVTIGGCGG